MISITKALCKRGPNKFCKTTAKACVGHQPCRDDGMKRPISTPKAEVPKAAAQGTGRCACAPIWWLRIAWKCEVTTTAMVRVRWPISAINSTLRDSRTWWIGMIHGYDGYPLIYVHLVDRQSSSVIPVMFDEEVSPMLHPGTDIRMCITNKCTMWPPKKQPPQAHVLQILNTNCL